MAVGYEGARRRTLLVVGLGLLMVGIVFRLRLGPDPGPGPLRVGSGVRTSAAGVTFDPSLSARSETRSGERVEIRPAEGAAAGAPVIAATPAELSRLIADLADDDVPGNATRARGVLRRIGTPAVPYLEQALFSGDHQQRWYAAFVLFEMEAPPSDALLQVAVEILDSRFRGGMRSREQATAYLAAHAAQARPWLVGGLGSRDAQQRYLSAYLLARAGERRYFASVCAELLPHLRDNDIASDAVYSANGLYRLGPDVLPWLRAERSRADAQMLQLLDLIERDLVDPPRDREEMRRRGKQHAVTRLYVDPVLELEIGRPKVPEIR